MEERQYLEIEIARRLNGRVDRRGLDERQRNVAKA